MPGASSLAGALAGFCGAPLADFVGAVDIEEMIGTTSPSVQRRYPLATVCRIWGGVARDPVSPAPGAGRR